MKSIVRLIVVVTALLFAVSANATPISIGFSDSDFDKNALLQDPGPDLTPDFGAPGAAPTSNLFSGNFGSKGSNSMHSAFGSACSSGMLEFQASGGLCGGKLGNARSGGARLLFEDGGDDGDGGQPTAVSEPGTLLLLGGGLMLLGFVGRRRRSA